MVEEDDGSDEVRELLENSGGRVIVRAFRM